MANEHTLEKMTKKIISLLKREREAITKGKHDQLEGINEEKIKLILQLEAYDKARLAGRAIDSELEALLTIMKRRSEENQKLLMAARKGIKMAQKQLKKIDDDVEGFGAYDANGKKISTPRSALKREQFI